MTVFFMFEFYGDNNYGEFIIFFLWEFFYGEESFWYDRIYVIILVEKSAGIIIVKC